MRQQEKPVFFGIMFFVVGFFIGNTRELSVNLPARQRAGIIVELHGLFKAADLAKYTTFIQEAHEVAVIAS